MLKSFPHDSVNIYPWIDVMRPSNFLQYKCLHLVVIYTFSRKPPIILSCVQVLRHPAILKIKSMLL